MVYIGIVYWGFALALLAYAAANSGPGWGVVFGGVWIVLLADCLWFYGVLPPRRRGDEERA